MENHSPYIIALREVFKSENNNIKPFKLQEDMSPLSGYEPNYNANKWNARDHIRNTHNCYAYILDKILPKRLGKPQPGYFANFPPIKYEDYTCDTFYMRLMKDLPGMYLTTFDEQCDAEYTKAFIAIDDKESERDYHFYREDSDGYWSHKPGRTEATRLDADGKMIKNPLKANRNYKYYQYSRPCFFFCLNPNTAKAYSKTNGK